MLSSPGPTQRLSGGRAPCEQRMTRAARYGSAPFAVRRGTERTDAADGLLRRVHHWDVGKVSSRPTILHGDYGRWSLRVTLSADACFGASLHTVGHFARDHAS